MTQEITKASDTEIEVITTSSTSVVESLSDIKERKRGIETRLAQYTEESDRIKNGLQTAIDSENLKIEQASLLGIKETLEEPVQ
jgi:hypothetical protein